MPGGGIHAHINCNGLISLQIYNGWTGVLRLNGFFVYEISYKSAKNIYES
jgi:hypothetical protein